MFGKQQFDCFAKSETTPAVSKIFFSNRINFIIRKLPKLIKMQGYSGYSLFYKSKSPELDVSMVITNIIIVLQQCIKVTCMVIYY